jgi:hypothetical protein
MGAPAVIEAARRMTSGFDSPEARAQAPRPKLVGILDRDGYRIVDIAFTRLRRKDVLEDGVTITLQGTLTRADRILMHFTDSLEGHWFSGEDVAAARTWVDTNNLDPFGIPYEERINHNLVDPLMQRVGTALAEGISGPTE